MKNKQLACAVIGTVAVLLVPRMGVAETPTEWVKTSVSEMQNVLPNGAQGESLTEEQVEKVSRLLDDKFDFAKLARMVLGRHWNKRTPAEQKEFVTLFQQLIEQSHVVRMATEAKAEQRFVGEEVEEDQALVEAVAMVDESEVPIEYVLIRNNGTWKIYDLGVDGMRLSQIYRAQFNKVISRDSYDHLIQRMKMKLEEIEMDNGKPGSSYSKVSSRR